MRSVRSAIWTSGDPVSPSLTAPPRNAGVFFLFPHGTHLPPKHLF